MKHGFHILYNSMCCESWKKIPGFSTLIHVHKSLKLKQTKLVCATMADSRTFNQEKEKDK